MKFVYAKLSRTLIFGLLLLVPLPVLAQFGNSISGFVFNRERQPVGDAPVELMDDFSRTIGRTRTGASGRYSFNRLPAGRFRIRTFSVPEYEDQEIEVEIQNISTSDISGNVRTSGFENVQRDFYLRPRRSPEALGRPDSVFVQEVPPDAKETFKTAVKDLSQKNEKEGLEGLKRSIELFPDYYEALEMLGTEYVKRKHFIPAQILLLKATQVNPRGYKSWYGLAYAFYSLKAPKEGVEAIEAALKLNSRSVEANLLAGVLLRQAGRPADAEKPLLNAKAASNGSIPDVHLHLALLYGNELRRYKEAVKELESYLKLSPEVKNKENVEKLLEEYKLKAKSPATK